MHDYRLCRAAIAVTCRSLLLVALSVLPATAGVNRWTAIGPEGATIAAIAIDPHTPSTVFAGTLGAGVLKSDDGGTSWVVANGALPSVNVSALAIARSDTSTIYAGTDAGVFKSTDAGKNWAAAGLSGMSKIYVSALAVDPETSANLYATTSDGLFKSIDGAASWTPLNVASGLVPRLVAIDPTAPATLFVGVDDYQHGLANGVFKSTDAGKSWTRVFGSSDGVADASSQIAAIAIDPTGSSHLFLATLFSGTVRSDDGGKTWSAIDKLGNVRALAIDPVSPSTIYGSTNDGRVFRSTDGGGDWTLVADTTATRYDVGILVASASAPGAVFFGGVDGISRSLDAAQTWTQLALGVRNIGVRALAVDPVAPSTIYAATGVEFTKSVDGGVHWTRSIVARGSPIGYIWIDPALVSTIYAGLGEDEDGFPPRSPLIKSTDAGANWIAASNGLLNHSVAALAIAPSHSSTLYAGQFATGIAKSVDGGSYWVDVNSGLPQDGSVATALAVDTTNADVVYAALSLVDDVISDSRVFKSTTAIPAWRQVTIPIPKGAQFRSIVIDPSTPSTLYAAYAYGFGGIGGVFKSDNGGETWAAAQAGLPRGTGVSALAIDSTHPERIYAATQAGVFRSTDGAVSWTPMNAGLSAQGVGNIAVDRTGTLLRVTTNAGLFEFQVVPQSPGTVALIEFAHAAFDDYFITASADEIRKLDQGLFSGWARTGFEFNAYVQAKAPAVPVCRFFSKGFAPKSTHFYTPFSAECNSLQKDSNWALESGLAFAIAVPGVDGLCAAELLPVYRLYNRNRGGVPNHRYTTDLFTRAQMIAGGWIPEGMGPHAVQMCSPQ